MVSGGRVGRNRLAGSSSPRLSLIAPVTGEFADITSTSPLINEFAMMFHDARLGRCELNRECCWQAERHTVDARIGRGRVQA